MDSVVEGVISVGNPHCSSSSMLVNLPIVHSVPPLTLKNSITERTPWNRTVLESVKKTFFSKQEPTSSCSPSSLYSATHYTEAKQSFTNTEASKKSFGSGNITNSCEPIESQKTRGSSGSDISDESSYSTLSALYKPHKANDVRWEAIQSVRSKHGALEMSHFKRFGTIGCGDISTVELAELEDTGTYFAMKFMKKAYLATRKKLMRAQTEKEIMQSLDHPFLPTLYAHFETEKLTCLVMEFCPGGDMHALQQKQEGKCFHEDAARFYVAEVLLALEYLHMLGVVYRDLKPENVLVREDGHIMLSDFDLSLRCAVCPTLVKSYEEKNSRSSPRFCAVPSCVDTHGCLQPARLFSAKAKRAKRATSRHEIHPPAGSALPELIAEPTAARSMSFVGTHEYLAPEIINGEGHGSAVDWWTLGIFLYELLFGTTPFKGQDNRATLFNIAGRPLRFPEAPVVSFAARDLIRGLLVKEPQHRLAYRRGAAEVKQHPFFQSVNWALIRCAKPPQVPGLDACFRLRAPAAQATCSDAEPSCNYSPMEFF